ncbi:hypothetical protein Tcan_08922 [Toxocara canis]|uniref:DUF148 domain-containing protein n=2 Tax=Toxocara canis TaxID=6265 RepID=A0A0B2VNE2_TOXCA|nr:hypothetical protein Tcan_08922 [Toxocara canis]VDM48264.1 unnamed protein product [Toxocara canis]
MHAFELLLLFVGLVANVSAQLVRHTEYYPNSPLTFMVGATSEQIEQFKRIVADRNLSIKEYNKKMEALVAQLSPAAQEAYMKRISEVKESRRKLGLKFLELTSNLDMEAKLAAKVLFDVAVKSEEYTPDEMLRKKQAILRILSKKALDQVGDVCFQTIQFAYNNGLPL